MAAVGVLRSPLLPDSSGFELSAEARGVLGNGGSYIHPGDRLAGRLSEELTGASGSGVATGAADGQSAAGLRKSRQGMFGTADYSAGPLSAPIAATGMGSPGPRSPLADLADRLEKENAPLRARMAVQDRRLTALEEALRPAPEPKE
jgi:hypothetical protein